MLNGLALIKWNIEKHYLKDIAKHRVPIVDTLWYSSFDKAMIAEAFEKFESDTIVIKPVLSANADDTFKLNRIEWLAQSAHLETVFKSRDFMIQPFLNSVVDEGEYSLFISVVFIVMQLKKCLKRATFGYRKSTVEACMQLMLTVSNVK